MSIHKKLHSFLSVLAVLCSCFFLSGCAVSPGNPELTRNTRLRLVDWHISGLWVINCPVAWVKVSNYNTVPIKDITFQYNSFDAEGHPLDEGTYTIDGTVQPGTIKNFIELYVGLVDLQTERLSVKLLSVERAG